jgi:hypothetical protein
MNAASPLHEPDEVQTDGPKVSSKFDALKSRESLYCIWYTIIATGTAIHMAKYRVRAFTMLAVLSILTNKYDVIPLPCEQALPYFP